MNKLLSLTALLLIAACQAAPHGDTSIKPAVSSPSGVCGERDFSIDKSGKIQCAKHKGA